MSQVRPARQSRGLCAKIDQCHPSATAGAAWPSSPGAAHRSPEQGPRTATSPRSTSPRPASASWWSAPRSIPPPSRPWPWARSSRRSRRRTSRREVGLGTGLPAGVPAHTVNRACASANEAIAEVALAIRPGDVRGRDRGRGREPLRRAHPAQPADGAGAGGGLAGAGRSAARLRAFAGFRPRDLVPEAPAIAEPSTGLTMGQSAEKMARENGITPRGAGPDRAGAAIARGRGHGRRAARRRAVRGPPAARVRGAAVDADNLLRPRHHARGARRAAARVRPQVRHRHRRQLVAADRRRRRRAAHVRGAGASRGLRAARVHPLVGDRGGGPGRTAPDGPGLRHPARRSSARA